MDILPVLYPKLLTSVSVQRVLDASFYCKVTFPPTLVSATVEKLFTLHYGRATPCFKTFAITSSDLF